MTDVLTPAKGLTQQTVGGNYNTWGDILNTTLGLVDSALGGAVHKTIVGGTELTTDDIKNLGYRFTGTLTTDSNVNWPVYYGLAVIKNDTTGGYSLSCGLDTGSRVTVPNGEVVVIWSDGTNFMLVGVDPAALGLTADSLYLNNDSTVGIYRTTAAMIGGSGPALGIKPCGNQSSHGSNVGPIGFNARGTLCFGSLEEFVQPGEAINIMSEADNSGTGCTAIHIAQWNAATSPYEPLIFWRSRGAHVGTTGRVHTGDALGLIQAQGDGGLGPTVPNLVAANIMMYADFNGNVTDSVVPGAIALQTTNDAGDTIVGLTVDKDQNVMITNNLIVTGPSSAFQTIGETAVAIDNLENPGVNGHGIGDVNFQGYNSTGGFRTYASIQAVIQTATSGSESAYINLSAMNGGTLSGEVSIGSGVAIPGSIAFKGSGSLNVENGVYDNGTAPTGTAGTGYVRATSPTLVTPAIGAATAASLVATGLIQSNAYVRATGESAPASGKSIGLYYRGSGGVDGALESYDFDASAWKNTDIYGTTVTTHNTSDERLKENIADLATTLSRIAALRPVTFNWKDTGQDSGEQIGFIAQDVEVLFPELVKTAPHPATMELSDGTRQTIAAPKTINYAGFIVPLIKAVQELYALVQAK